MFKISLNYNRIYSLLSLLIGALQQLILLNWNSLPDGNISATLTLSRMALMCETIQTLHYNY